MIQNYQDAMAICRWAGNPDLFITFSANPKWLEIQSFLDEICSQNPQDRPDIEMSLQNKIGSVDERHCTRSTVWESHCRYDEN